MNKARDVKIFVVDEGKIYPLTDFEKLNLYFLDHYRPQYNQDESGTIYLQKMRTSQTQFTRYIVIKTLIDKMKWTQIARFSFDKCMYLAWYVQYRFGE